jgi:hypothetical protein
MFANLWVLGAYQLELLRIKTNINFEIKKVTKWKRIAFSIQQDLHF